MSDERQQKIQRTHPSNTYTRVAIKTTGTGGKTDGGSNRDYQASSRRIFPTPRNFKLNVYPNQKAAGASNTNGFRSKGGSFKLLKPILTHSIVDLLLSQCASYDDQLKVLSCYLDTTRVYVAIDSEWDTDLKWTRGFANWLQSAALVTYYHEGVWKWHLFLFTSLSIPEKSAKEIIDAFGDLSYVTLMWQNLPNHAPVIEQWLNEQESEAEVVELVGKYSPLDYHAYFGHAIWLHEIVDEKLVTQKRCIRFDVNNSRKGRRCYKPSTLSRFYSIRDLQGLNSGSLKKQAESVGRKLFAKDMAGHYIRGRMRQAYVDIPLESTVYNICDTFAAMQIALDYIPLVNEIIASLGLPEHQQITFAELAHTTGSLVGRVFCSFIEYYPIVLAHHGKLKLSERELDRLLIEWRLSLWKNAKISDKLNSRDHRVANEIIAGQLKCKTIEDYEGYLVNTSYGSKQETEELLINIVLNSRFMRRLFQGSLYEQACAKVLGSNVEATSVFAALVQGGRCNNSCPFESRVKRVLDIDMSSCYGSTLRKLTYPIGLPTIYSRSLTFGEKLEPYYNVYQRLEPEFINDLWFGDICSKETLAFSQDLLFSSYDVTPEKIRKAVTGVEHYESDYEGFIEVGEKETDVKKIPSNFSLTRRQLERARVCASSHRVLEKVANDKEKGELKKKLECSTLVYYPKSQQFTDIQKFTQHMLRSKGTVTTDDKNNVTDARTRAWFGLDLELFIGVLVNVRKKLKNAMKSATGEAKDALNAKQEMYKLFVNTLYGDLASVYFSFGNVVLANVITDKARVGAWMMSKALRTRMEITDGGFYSPLAVAFNRGSKLPGLDVLSHWQKWEQKRTADGIVRELGCLGETTPEFWESYFSLYNRRLVDLTEVYDLKGLNKANGIIDSQVETLACAEGTEALDALVDNLADEHIKNFWQPYGLSFEFGVEHKYEHIGWAVGYMSKSDYCILTLGNTPNVIRKRGSRPPNSEIPMNERDERYYKGVDPAFEFLEALAKGDTSRYVHRGYEEKNLCKLAEYQDAKLLKGDIPEPKTIAQHKTNESIVPGWELRSSREPRQINNGHIYLDTYANYESIHGRKLTDKGERVQLFERYINDCDKFTSAISSNTLDVAQKKRNEKKAKA